MACAARMAAALSKLLATDGGCESRHKPPTPPRNTPSEPYGIRSSLAIHIFAICFYRTCGLRSRLVNCDLCRHIQEIGALGRDGIPHRKTQPALEPLPHGVGSIRARR